MNVIQEAIPQTIQGRTAILHTSRDLGKSTQHTSIEELRDRPSPVSMGRFHAPIRYDYIDASFERGIRNLGLDVVKKELILAREGKLLMGTYEINGTNGMRLPGDLPNRTLMCYMASENQLTAMRARVGNQIAMCDNLLFSGGSVLIAKKFTTHAQIGNSIWQGIKKWIDQKFDFEAKLNQLNEAPLTHQEGAAQILAVAAGNKAEGTRRCVPFKYAEKTYDEWCKPSGADTAPRTQWGLVNAWTRSLREAPLQSKMASTVAIAGYYGI